MDHNVSETTTIATNSNSSSSNSSSNIAMETPSEMSSIPRSRSASLEPMMMSTLHWAKKLNNRAAVCIETGRYDRAVANLIKALKLTEEQDVQEQRTSRSSCKGCQHCCLEACMNYSQEYHSTFPTQQQKTSTTNSSSDNSNSNSNNNKKAYSEPEPASSTASTSSSSSSSSSAHPSVTKNQMMRRGSSSGLHYNMNETATCSTKQSSSEEKKNVPSTSSSSSSILTEEDGNSVGYIFQTPMRVHPNAILDDRHAMHLTLPLIITFNLALVHHLAFLKHVEKHKDEINNNNDDKNDGEGVEPFMKSKGNRKKLAKILQLYELAYRWQMEDNDDDDDDDNSSTVEWEEEYHPTDCVRFTMVISNNLGEIHRIAKSPTKYDRCLQHLLSTVMYWIDYKQTYGGNDNDSNSDSIPSTASGTAASNGETERRKRRRQQQEQDSIMMDGFLRNVSSLYLKGPCAGAA